MSPPKIDFASLRERTAPLPAGREDAVHASVLVRQGKHAAGVRFAQIGAAIVLAAAVALFFTWPRPAATVAHVAPAGSAVAPPVVPAASSAEGGGDFGGVVLSDGSRVVFLTPGTQLVQEGSTGRRSTLVRGAARFDVVHDDAAPFRVTAGSVVVEDVGTVFTVRQEDGGRTSVSVHSGSVNVRGPDGEERLVAGASEVFPRLAPPPEPEPPAPPGAPSAARRPPSWQRLARAGDYARAYAVIERAGPVRDDADDLLLAADSARLTGHPSRAVPFLRRFIDRFPADPRASLATFTLGRVLLDDLAQPREAARAFAAAYAGGGQLAEDALAREVEAWDRAGDVAAARSAAARYLAAYPAGRRAAFARRVAQGP